MHRQLVYPGQIPLETDVLSTDKDAYVGLAKLSQALFGNSTVVNGLSAGQTGPASLAVLVQPGEIYSLQQTDTSGYSTLGTDSLQILKQGIITATTTLNTPAPVTGGFSINYLVQAGFIESDALPVVLPYYNASNPSVAWSGPANSGTPQNTQRQDLCSVTIKAGTAAATGTQVTPSADAGFVGLWVVTVANGQATVTAANISAYPGAPFIHGSQNNPLFPISNLAATTNPAVTNDNTQGYVIGSKWLNTSTGIMFMAINVTTGAAVWVPVNDVLQLPTGAGTANAQTVTNTWPIKALTAGTPLRYIPGVANSASATVNPDTLGNTTVKAWGQNLIGGELQVGVPADMRYDGTNLNLLNPGITALGLVSGALEATIITANGNFTPLTSGKYLLVAIGGGGGGGGGGGSSTTLGGSGGFGGGGGQMGFSIVTLVAGTPYAVVIGAAGAVGTHGAINVAGSDGGNGGNTTFNAVVIGTGGLGGRAGRGQCTSNASIGGGNGGGFGGAQGAAGLGSSNAGGGTGANASANTGGGGGGGGGGGTNGSAQIGGDGGTGGTGILIVIRA